MNALLSSVNRAVPLDARPIELQVIVTNKNAWIFRQAQYFFATLMYAEKRPPKANPASRTSLDAKVDKAAEKASIQ